MRKSSIIILTFQLFSILTALVGEDLIQRHQDQDVLAFQVGTITISKFLYDREKGELIGNKSISQKKPTDAELKTWIKGWIKRLQIVNWAIDQGYVDYFQVNKTTRIIGDYTLINGEDSPFARHILKFQIRESSQNTVELSPSERKQKQEEAFFELKNNLAKQITLEIEPEIAFEVLPRFKQLVANSGGVEAHDRAAEVLYRYSINGQNSPN